MSLYHRPFTQKSAKPSPRYVQRSRLSPGFKLRSEIGEVTVMTSGLLTSLNPDSVVTSVPVCSNAIRRRSGFQVSKTTACLRNLYVPKAQPSPGRIFFVTTGSEGGCTIPKLFVSVANVRVCTASTARRSKRGSALFTAALYPEAERSSIIVDNRPPHYRSGPDKMISETTARLTVQKPACGDRAADSTRPTTRLLDNFWGQPPVCVAIQRPVSRMPNRIGR